MVNLNDDFSNFAESDEAKKPAFDVKSDWRKQQYLAAKLNDDLEADANPDKSLQDGYVDVTPEDEDSENYEYKDDGSPRASW